jgi:hypothetical protein
VQNGTGFSVVWENRFNYDGVDYSALNCSGVITA